MKCICQLVKTWIVDNYSNLVPISTKPWTEKNWSSFRNRNVTFIERVIVSCGVCCFKSIVVVKYDFEEGVGFEFKSEETV